MNSAMDPGWPALLAIGKSGWDRIFAYRARMVLRIIRWMLRLFMLRVVWEAVYGDQRAVDGIALKTMLVYVTVSLLHDFATESNVVFEIDQRIQSGRVASDMIRPVGFVPQMIALDIGTVLARLPLMMVALPFSAMIGVYRLPSSFEAAAGYFVSTILGWLVGMLVWMIVGLFGFWMTNTMGLRFMLGSLQAFLTGALVPLWFLPGWLETAMSWTPFPMTVYIPVSIYVGQRSGDDLWRGIGAQVAWVVVLGAIVAWQWSRAQHKLVVQGG